MEDNYIFKEVKNVNFQAIKHFLSTGGDVNVNNAINNSLLHELASMAVPEETFRQQIVSLAHLLIKSGICIEHQNKWGVSAVYEAVSSGFIELIELFLESNIKLLDHISLNEFLFYNWPRHPSQKQRTDFPKVLTKLLSEQPNLEVVNEQYRNFTALQIACKEGASQAILQLLNAGALPNVGSENSVSPLTLLCHCSVNAQREYYEAIDALLNAGADPNFLSNDNNKFESSTSALIRSVIYGGKRKEVVERLLSAGANVHYQDGKGHDALYYAKQSKREDLVRLLTTYGG